MTLRPGSAGAAGFPRRGRSPANAHEPRAALGVPQPGRSPSGAVSRMPARGRETVMRFLPAGLAACPGKDPSSGSCPSSPGSPRAPRPRRPVARYVRAAGPRAITSCPFPGPRAARRIERSRPWMSDLAIDGRSPAGRRGAQQAAPPRRSPPPAGPSTRMRRGLVAGAGSPGPLHPLMPAPHRRHAGGTLRCSTFTRRPAGHRPRLATASRAPGNLRAAGSGRPAVAQLPGQRPADVGPAGTWSARFPLAPAHGHCSLGGQAMSFPQQQLRQSLRARPSPPARSNSAGVHRPRSESPPVAWSRHNAYGASPALPGT